MKTDSPTTITTLSENTASKTGLLAEWGISMLVEDGQNTILFDTGYSSTVVHNAKILGKNLSKIEKIVLSHGHLDHTGGLLPVLKSITEDLLAQKNRKIEIIAHPDIWQKKYDIENDKAVWGGMPTTEKILESNGAHFKYSTKPQWLTENICATGEIFMQTDYEYIENDLVIKQGDQFVQDSLADDQSLIIKTSKGLVALLGCSHRGIINILLQAQKITGEARIYMVMGGTHLLNASQDRVNKTIAALKKLNVQKIGVSHCTGLPVAAKFADVFGDKFFFNNAGTVVSVAK